MHRKLLSAIFLLIFVSPTFAQRPGGGDSPFEIKGQLIDESTQQPLEFATISLLNASDSALVDGTITDPTGIFSLKPKPGKYILKLQFISYGDVFKTVSLSRENRTVDIGKVVMSPDTETLQEVVVTGAKDQMQLELDKRVFNVAENLNNIGANAADILEQLPSVAVDVEGNVSLRGSQNVRILVNGKPSGLVGINSQDGLRQLQGDLVERIEVVTNPSARYDAEGSAGIINIILKKEQKRGFNGAFTTNLGWPANYGFTGNANYRSGAFNLFGSYGINYRENPGGGYTDIKYVGNDSTTYIDNDRVRSGTSHNFRFGADFYLNENNILTASAVVRISDEENITDLQYTDRDENSNIIRNQLRQDVEKEDDDNYEYELNYTRTFKGEGHELTAQFQYRDNDETEASNIGQADFQQGETLSEFQRSTNIQGDKNILAQVDYVYPMGEGKKFEAGYRGTLREISSYYNVLQIDSLGAFVPIEETFEDRDFSDDFVFSNEFIYDEDVHAGYAIFENKMDKWGYQLGLRVEQTYITTYQREGDDTIEKDYLNAFPSAFVSYNLSKIRTIQASYSRRLSRPRFWYLNPFSSFSDPRNIRTGNTDLDPEYTDSYELGILNNLKKASIYIGGYYRYTTGIIERISVPGEFAGISSTITTPYNIGVEDAFGIEGNFSVDPTEWFNINGNANFYRAITEGSFEGKELGRDAVTANFRLNTRAKVGKMNFQVSGNYRAPQNTVQGKRRSIYSIDLGANLDVFNGKGTLNLSVSDLFNTRKYRGDLVTEEQMQSSEFQWRSRQARLSFTYRINQKKERGGKRGEDGDYDGGGEEF
uniref:TonB-dependent receptor domain-containing protein n=1 Tax=Fulvivirga sp. TaxID=1931237 RepID=UPI0040495924